MPLDDDRKLFSEQRILHANECLSDAFDNFRLGNIKTAANRGYYAVFHAMRAVLAYDDLELKHHSGVVSEFRRRYLKTEIFPKSYSEIIEALWNARHSSDYDDFFTLSSERTAEMLNDASEFVHGIEEYLQTR